MSNSPSFAAALAAFRAGDLPTSQSLCDELLRSEPHNADALHLSGAIAHRAGKPHDARQLLERALAARPNAADVLNTLALVHGALRDPAKARDCLKRALVLNPQLAEAHNNLGSLLVETRQPAAAIEHFQRAIALRERYIDAYANLARAHALLEQLDAAEAAYRQAIELEPTRTQSHYQLGTLLEQRGDLDGAEQCFGEALRLSPSHAEACNSLGAICRARGQLDAAAEWYQRALAAQPNFALAHNNLGVIHKARGEFEAAIECFQRALALDSTMAAFYTNLANVQQELGRQQQAEANLVKSIELAPNDPLAHLCLGNVRLHAGLFAEALHSYDRAAQLSPSDGLRVRRALAVPTILESAEQAITHREQLAAALDALEQTSLAIGDPLTEIGATPFRLAYHGIDDLLLQQRIVRLLLRATPSLVYSAPHCRKNHPPQARRLRVGVISRFFYEHPIGRHFVGLFERLARDEFELVVLRLNSYSDALTAQLNQRADRSLLVPGALELARTLIAEQQLDVLIYTDLGMEPLTWLLAMSRLAPVQCVLTGHPVTTGIETVDYFISQADMEPPEGDRHYSERLVRMRHMPSAMALETESVAGEVLRASLGLREGERLYVCAQTLFKVHPDMDTLLTELLRRDPAGQVRFFQGSRSQWNELLQRRWQRTIGEDARRIRFLPRAKVEHFRAILATADAVLDSVHFTGGTTSMDALAVAAPVVTLPGEFMRGRQTFGLHKLLGLDELVARDGGDYVEIALRLAHDAAFRRQMSETMIARRSQAFNAAAAAAELAEFLQTAARG